MNEVSSIDRRLNYIQAQMQDISEAVDLARLHRWPEFAVVPFLKMRGKLRREFEMVTALKNKREQEKQERKRMIKEQNLVAKFNRNK